MIYEEAFAASTTSSTKQYMEGTNVVLLDPDVAAVFRDSESVNQALQVLVTAVEQLDQGHHTQGD